MLTNTQIRSLLAQISAQPTLQIYMPLERLSDWLQANITIMDNTGSIFFTSKTKANQHEENTQVPVIHRGTSWGQVVINKASLTEEDLVALEILLSIFSIQLR